METNENYFTSTKAAMQEYVEERLLLLKLKAVKTGGQVAGSLTVVTIALLLVVALLVVLGITGGLLFASVTGSYFSGFAIISGIYLLLVIIVAIWLKRPLIRYVNNTIIKTVFNTSASKTHGHG